MASNFTDIGQLRFWCQKILPLVYDDSLSYYELLCKVVEKLNLVIQNVDGLPDYIGELLSEDKIKPILDALIDDLRSNIAVVNEKNSPTATDDRHTGELLWWKDNLYEVVRDMNIGDAYIDYSSNPNIKHVTVEELIDNLRNNIVNIIEPALNDIRGEIAQEVTDRSDADNTLQGNIDAEATARENADNVLQGNIDAEATARENSDNLLNQKIENLTEYDKADIRNYGGKGDGVTNDTQAFNDCMAENNTVYLPYFNGCGGYVLDEVILNSHQSVRGDSRTTIIANSNKLFTFVGNYISVRDLYIYCDQSKRTIIFNMKFTGSTGFAVHFTIDNISADRPYTIFTDAECTQRYICLYMNNVIGYQTGGVGYYLHHGFAFIFMKSCTTDRVSLQANYRGFDFDDVEGLHLDYCECSAGYWEENNEAGSGFVFTRCRAVWLNNCFSDYVAGLGYDFVNCWYIYIQNTGASIVGLNGFRFSGCKFVTLGTGYIAGRDTMGAASSGIWVNGCENMAISNSNIDIFTYNGIYITASNKVLLSNVNITNTPQASINIDNSIKTIANGCIGDNTMVVTGENSYILNSVDSTGFIDTRPAPVPPVPSV